MWHTATQNQVSTPALSLPSTALALEHIPPSEAFVLFPVSTRNVQLGRAKAILDIARNRYLENWGGF